MNRTGDLGGLDASGRVACSRYAPEFTDFLFASQGAFEYDRAGGRAAVRFFPNTVVVEAKAYSKQLDPRSISKGRDFISHLSDTAKMQRMPPHLPPQMIFLTPRDTVIPQSILDHAKQKGVAVCQIYLEENVMGTHLRLGAGRALVEPKFTFDLLGLSVVPGARAIGSYDPQRPTPFRPQQQVVGPPLRKP